MKASTDPACTNCIENPNSELRGKTYCGRYVRNDYVFASVDHALRALSARTRPYICPGCVEKIVAEVQALQKDPPQNP